MVHQLFLIAQIELIEIEFQLLFMFAEGGGSTAKVVRVPEISTLLIGSALVVDPFA